MWPCRPGMAHGRPMGGQVGFNERPEVSTRLNLMSAKPLVCSESHLKVLAGSVPSLQKGSSKCQVSCWAEMNADQSGLDTPRSVSSSAFQRYKYCAKCQPCTLLCHSAKPYCANCA